MEKEEMLDSVRNYMSFFGEIDYMVLEVMRFVDRAKFCPFDEEVYFDIEKEIGFGGFVDRPSSVARMISLLKVRDSDSVLEVGTGSGWVAAMLSRLARNGSVLSTEINEDLVDVANENCNSLGGFVNLSIENVDFYDLNQKFDKIVFSCGIGGEEEYEITNWMREHLYDGGIGIVPYAEGPLVIFEMKDGELNSDYTKEEYCFSRLIS